MRLYKGPSGMSFTPSTRGLQLAGKKTVHLINFENQNSFKNAISATPNENYMWVFGGTVYIFKKGMYTWCTKSDDGSTLFVDNRKLVDNEGLHGPRLRCKRKYMRKGGHAVKAIGFQRGGGAYMKLFYKGKDTGNRMRLARSYRWRSYKHRAYTHSGWNMRIYKAPGGISRVNTRPWHLQKLGQRRVSRIRFKSVNDFKRKISATPESNFIWAYGGTLKIHRYVFQFIREHVYTLVRICITRN